MFDFVNKEYIKNNEFKNTGLEEVVKEEKLYRLSQDKVRKIDLDIDKKNKLKKKISKIAAEKFGADFTTIEVKCNISETSMRKYLKGTRNITRAALMRFCSGACIDIEEANELFILLGHALDPENNRLDAIVVDNIKCKEGIEVLYEECEKYELLKLVFG